MVIALDFIASLSKIVSLKKKKLIWKPDSAAS
jgi:hypothetical protein